MKFKGLVLCSDLDGTLLNEKNTVPKENLEAIEYFRENGGKFMIATGRLPDAVAHAIGDLKLDFPCICHNGCSVYDFERKVYVEKIPLDEGVIQVAEDILKISPNSGLEVITEQGICVVKRTPATDFHLTYEKLAAIYADKISDAPKPWFKLLFAQKAMETEHIIKEISKTAHRESYNMQKSHSFYYEVYSKNASKGMALLKLCEDYDIDIKNVIAIGDNENDIAMLDVAGTSAAAANASDYVKSFADIVTCSNEEGAIADLIAKL